MGVLERFLYELLKSSTWVWGGVLAPRDSMKKKWRGGTRRRIVYGLGAVPPHYNRIRGGKR